MDRRLELHAELVAALGSSHVYYQPPPTVKMVYPCIVYQRDNEDRTYADNHGYLIYDRYQVTVIDRNPDSVLWKRLTFRWRGSPRGTSLTVSIMMFYQYMSKEAAYGC